MPHVHPALLLGSPVTPATKLMVLVLAVCLALAGAPPIQPLGVLNVHQAHIQLEILMLAKTAQQLQVVVLLVMLSLEFVHLVALDSAGIVPQILVVLVVLDSTPTEVFPPV